MKISVVSTAVALCLVMPACTSTGPQKLSGRHRQPINVQPIVVPVSPATMPAVGSSARFHEDAPALPSPTPTAPPAQDVAIERDVLAEPATAAAAASPTDECVVATAHAEELGSASQRVYRIHFDYGKATLQVPPAVQAEMLELAKAAKRISIRGRTDAARFTAGDEQIALRRALAMRTYLITHGVPATQIELQFASAQDFLADNSTAAGRSQNRRVDVVLDLGLPPSPTVATN